MQQTPPSFTDYESSLDWERARRYQGKAPRYTSYPTAPHFDDDYDAARYLDDLTEKQDRPQPLSLYVHIPFCPQLCYYCGCHQKTTQDRSVITEYLDCLKDEIAAVAYAAGNDRSVIQIHWGGGTPTYLTPEEIDDLAAYIHDQFAVAPNAEIGLEVDPRNVSREHLDVARHQGFNRLSLGVQDFNMEVLSAINRPQPKELTVEALQWARELDFESVNFDLIYGLPYQTRVSFEQTLQEVLKLQPGRLAVYNYAHVPQIQHHQRLIPEDALPDPSERLELFKMTIDRLSEKGPYQFIGMDHFALPDDPLSKAARQNSLWRNFQGYSTHSDAEVIAFGVSGIGQFTGSYVQNTKNFRRYRTCITEGKLPIERGLRLRPEDRLRRRVIMEFMSNLQIRKRAIEEKFGVRFDQHFRRAISLLQQAERDGLVRIEPDTITATPAGRLLLRPLAASFDSYLQTEKQPVHAATI